MAPDYETARKMVDTCRQAGIPFFVHENYRWQPQIRRVKEILDSGEIGLPFRARTWWNTAYPVFETQPFLAELEQFIAKPIRLQAEALYTQEQYDVVLI